MSQSGVKFTIAFTDPELDNAEQDDEAKKLLQQMDDLDEIKTSRIPDPNPPKAGKGLGFLAGMLTAEVSAKNIKALLGFLGDRLSGKTIEIEVENNGRKLKVKASSQQELLFAIQEAKNFLEVGE